MPSRTCNMSSLNPAALVLRVSLIVFANLFAAIAFAPPPVRPLQPSQTSIGRRIPTRCRYRNFNDTVAEDDAGTSTSGTSAPTSTSAVTTSPWTLAEDWALIDGVRTFTIGGCSDFDSPSSSERNHPDHNRPRTAHDDNNDGRRYTFWHRMVRTVPELRKDGVGRSADEAMERYQVLLREADDTPPQPTESSDRGSGRARRRRLPPAGPSPSMLHEWWIHATDDHSNVVGMGGILDDGRNVWFPLRSLGRFDGHAMDVLAGPTGIPPTLAAAALPGGYAEDAGGKVYELGSPRVSKEDDDAAAAAAVAEGGTAGSEVTQAFRQTATATMSAIAAVYLLSAAVGFGAGLSLSQSEATSLPAAAVQQEYYMGAPVKDAASSIPARSAARRTRTPQSVSEMRARQEVRVLQEKRLLRDIEGRLGGDEARLDELRQLERTMMQNTELN